MTPLRWTRTPPTEAGCPTLGRLMERARVVARPVLDAVQRGTHRLDVSTENLPDGGIRVTYTATPIAPPEEPPA